jgi:hypothetical protein
MFTSLTFKAFGSVFLLQEVMNEIVDAIEVGIRVLLLFAGLRAVASFCALGPARDWCLVNLHL